MLSNVNGTLSWQYLDEDDPFEVPQEVPASGGILGSVASVESEFRIWYKGGKKLAQCHFIFPPNYSSILKDFALHQKSSCSLYI
jgi:hypothetical protein